KLNIFFAANYFKSYAYYHLKNKSKALKAFYNIEDGVNEKSFKDKNKYINYLRIISELLYRNGESTKATFYLDKIIYSNDISSFGKFYYSGVKNFYLKKYSVALVFFKESLKLEPNNYSVKKNIDLCNKLINKNK
ncbi:MAG: hypothetical protein GY756_20910, partial [bacterium]|nr:hypothetical protein [bacterium]